MLDLIDISIRIIVYYRYIYCQSVYRYFCYNIFIMTEFGNRLKELRNEKGISQQALGLEIKSSQSVISDWENGNAEPTASAIVAVADYFGVSTDFLLGKKEY